MTRGKEQTLPEAPAELHELFRDLARGHAPALLAYSMLTFIMLFPLFGIFGSGTLGQEYDNLFFVRQVWWVAHAIRDLHVSPLFDPTSYYPLGYALGRGAYAPVMTFPAVPLTWLLGPIASHNVLIVLSFLLSALGTYAWVARLTGDRWAGFVAGTVMAMLPYRFAHVIHLNLVTTQWMPWTLWAFERYLDKPARRWAVAVGISAGFIALSDWYYAYSAALLLPIYFWIRLRRHARPPRSRLLVHGALAASSAFVLVAPFLFDSARLWKAGGLGGYAFSPPFFDLNPYDFFVPNLMHPLWGEAVGKRRIFYPQFGFWTERGVVLGYTAVALAVVALFRRRGSRGVAAIAWVWGVSYLVALGSWLRWGDRAVHVPVSHAIARVVQRWIAGRPAFAGESAESIARGELPVPLPALFLYVFVPLTRGMRVMARFGVWTGLMTAALAGWGTTVLFELRNRRQTYASAARDIRQRAAILALISAAVLFESWTKLPTIRLVPRQVDLWLKDQPDTTVVVEFPVQQNLRPMQDYYKTVHQRRTVFGPVGDSFPGREKLARANLLNDFPAPAALNALRGFRTTHILITQGEVSNWPAFERAIAGVSALHYERTLGDVRVYTLD